jgi:heat shock protein HslJ
VPPAGSARTPCRDRAPAIVAQHEGAGVGDVEGLHALQDLHEAALLFHQGGRAFRGCGGEPEALLIGAEWVVEDIGGTLIDRSRATLDFGADGRLAGRASCNAFTTTYKLTGESLTIGATATTMMSCAPSLMEQERRFLEILQRVRTFDVTDTGALVLRDELGRAITARRPR